MNLIHHSEFGSTCTILNSVIDAAYVFFFSFNEISSLVMET